MNKLYLLYILPTLLTLTTPFHNPGILLQIPTQYQLPTPSPPLPTQIPSILLQKLELTQIQLRTLEYNWKYLSDRFVIGLQYTVISFDWKYGHDGGIGTFVEEFSDLVVMVTFDVDKEYRFKVDIDGAKITNEDKRHSIKISLGGKVPETIVVQVTNLILNHAKVLFRAAIKNAIAKIVQDFTQPLRKDIKIICKESPDHKQHCIYLNTTLVGKPLIAQNRQLIQINGAPYLEHGSSGYLDPKNAMFKVNSSEINAQLHEDVITRILTLYNQISPIDLTIISTEISGVADIDSQTLTVVFPKMRDYANPLPVLLEVTIGSISCILQQSPYLTFKASGKIKVSIQKQPKQITPYLTNSSGTATIKLQPITKIGEASIRIHKVNIDSLQFDPTDIKNNVVNPPEIVKHLPTLMQWAQGGINGDLNAKVERVEFVGLRVGVKVRGLNQSVNVQIGFQSGKSVGKDGGAVLEEM